MWLVAVTNPSSPFLRRQILEWFTEFHITEEVMQVQTVSDEQHA